MTPPKAVDLEKLNQYIDFFNKSTEHILKTDYISRERGSIIITTDWNGRPTQLQNLLICIGALATFVVPQLIQENEVLRARVKELEDGGA
jgi:hypothetical protein